MTKIVVGDHLFNFHLTDSETVKTEIPLTVQLSLGSKEIKKRKDSKIFCTGLLTTFSNFKEFIDALESSIDNYNTLNDIPKQVIGKNSIGQKKIY